MAAKLCKKQQISFGNNTKYSDFIDGKKFLEKLALKRALLFKEYRVQQKILLIYFTEISGIDFN